MQAVGVCGGRPTFKYTRIEITGALERLAAGQSIADLVQVYRGRVSREAIVEAIQVKITLSETTYQTASQLAEQKNLSLSDLITHLVTEKVQADDLARRAQRGNRTEFERIMNRVQPIKPSDSSFMSATGDTHDLANLGESHAMSGVTAQAIDYYGQALALSQTENDSTNIAIHSWNLGLLHEATNPSRAITLLSTAVTYFEAVNHAQAAIAHQRLEQIRRQAH